MSATRKIFYETKEISMGMMQEFKEFAMKGNVMDLAVGVITVLNAIFATFFFVRFRSRSSYWV